MTTWAYIRAGRDSFGHCGIPRHRHAVPYAALVLAGGYEECGTFGCHRVKAGAVLLHRSFDAHLNRFGPRGARVLNLLLAAEPGYALGAVSDPDAIARLAERDLAAAGAALGEQLRPLPVRAGDWPEVLAQDLQRDPQLHLQRWAHQHRLAPATLSRGFRRVFATAPAGFRVELRVRAALALIAGGDAPLATVAATVGFADQAHMSRAVKAMAGHPPRYWRRPYGHTRTPLSIP